MVMGKVKFLFLRINRTKLDKIFFCPECIYLYQSREVSGNPVCGQVNIYINCCISSESVLPLIAGQPPSGRGLASCWLRAARSAS